MNENRIFIQYHFTSRMTEILKNDSSTELGNKTPQPKSLLSKGIYFDRCYQIERSERG